MGLAAFALGLAVPQFAAAMKFDRLGEATTENWLLWGSGVLGLLAVTALVTNVPAVVSILAAACAATGTAGVAMTAEVWELGSPVTWSSVGLLGAFVIPGLCAALALRQD